MRACFGSTSVRKPRIPMFMARIGGSGFGIERQVLRIVPSPPMVIMKSVFIWLRERVFASVLVLPANVSSMYTSSPFAVRCLARSSTSSRAFFLS